MNTSLYEPQPSIFSDHAPPPSQTSIAAASDSPEIRFGFRELRGAVAIVAHAGERRDYTIAELYECFSNPHVMLRVPILASTLKKFADLIDQIVEPAVGDNSCVICGCTNDDCRRCIKRTGKPCHWVAPHLCSACCDGGAR